MYGFREQLLICTVKQHAILSRLGVETASNSFHPSVSRSGVLAGGIWSVFIDIIERFWKQGMVLIDLNMVKIVLGKPIVWKKLDADGWKVLHAD